MTNYDVYFGTQARAVDSLSILFDYYDCHPRKEVTALQTEIKRIGSSRWLVSECTNPRWWAGVKFPPERGGV